MNEIPTISEIYEKIINDYETRLSVSFPAWGRFYIRTHAAVNAAIFYMIFLRNHFVYRNMLPDTADTTANGGTLERWGLIVLGRLPFKATQGKYTITGIGDNGSVVPADTSFVSARNGEIYTNPVAFTFSMGSASFDVVSVNGGTDVRLVAGDKLELVSPIANIDREFTVTLEVTVPQDAEKIDLYRDKVLDAFRYQSRGGAAADYRFWADAVPGIREVYPYTGSPLPNVNLYIEASTGNGVPSPSLINDVKNVIEPERPLGIFVNYFPVYFVNLDITINNSSGLTTSEQTLITNDINDYLYNKRPFIQATDIVQNDIINKNEIIGIIQSTSPSVVFGNIDVLMNGVSQVSYMLGKGEIPYLNSLNFV